MSETKSETRRRVLDPIERSSEVLFGLIMVLSFTGSISVATADRDDVRTMFFGALGCNLAWGIVDAIMYLLNTLGARGRELKIVRDLLAARSSDETRRAIEEALPERFADALGPSDYEAIAARVREQPAPPANPRLHRDDFVGAASVFWLVFAATLPVVIPFAVMRHNARLAMRFSNWIALAMLFLTGLSLGRYAFRRPWAVGLFMVAIGLVLVAITIALGG
jgi:hypothetical protein